MDHSLSPGQARSTITQGSNITFWHSCPFVCPWFDSNAPKTDMASARQSVVGVAARIATASTPGSIPQLYALGSAANRQRAR